MTIYFPLIHTNTHNLQGQGPVQVRLILCASLFMPASAGRERWLARSTLDSAAVPQQHVPYGQREAAQPPQQMLLAPGFGGSQMPP